MMFLAPLQAGSEAAYALKSLMLKARKASLCALALLSVLDLCQLLLKQGSSFLGLSTQALAWDFINLYPEVALSELLKLHLYLFAWAFLASLLTLLGWQKAQRLAAHGRAFPLAKGLYLLPLLSYLLLLASSLLTYPAFYEPSLPLFLLKAIHSLAFYLNPKILGVAAFGSGFLALSHAISMLPYKPPYRVSLIGACGLGLGALTFNPSLALQEKPAKPPLFLIAVDSLRYDRSLNANLCPHLTALRSDPHSVSFHDHHVGIPRTFPSWLEMLNGKYAARTGIRHMFPGLAIRRHPTFDLSAALAELGYNTAVFSDFAGDIFPRFTHSFQHVDTPNLDIPSLIRLSIDQAFPLYLPFLTSKLGTSFFRHLRASPNFADPFSLIQRVNTYLQEQASPFFATVFFSTAHFPYAAPWPWYQRFADKRYQGPYYFQKNPDMSASHEQLTAADKQQIRALYDGAVGAVDAAIGELIAELKAAELYDDSMIVVTADHGEDLYEEGVLQGHGEHLRGENVLKTPWFIKLPASLPFPARKDFYETSRSVDIFPTLLSLVGGKMPAGERDGVDLSPWLLGQSHLPFPSLAAYSETGLWFAPKGEIFFQKERLPYPGISQLLQLDPGHSGDIILKPQYESLVVTAKHRSYSKGPFKLIYSPTPQAPLIRLYDRQADPENRQDISSQYPEVLSALQSEFFCQIANIEGQFMLLNGYVVPR